MTINTAISWVNGGGATSYDVWFGTTPSPPFVRNQTGTSYSPGNLEYGKTYYWRIDAKNSCTTTVGDVWSFTTIGGCPSINLLQPATPITVKQGDIISLSWSATDPNSTARIALAHDTDNNPENGNDSHSLIRFNLTASGQGSSNVYEWDTLVTPPGTYYIWAQIYDGTTCPAAYSIAPGRVTINPQSLIDSVWQTINVDGENYQIHVVSKNAISNLSTTPLMKDAHGSLVEYIYMKNDTGAAVSGSISDLVIAGQSRKKVQTGLIALQDVYGIASSDLVSETFEDYSGNFYNTYSHQATNYGWRHAFIHSGQFFGLGAGIRTYSNRVERYKEVIMDLVLQPDKYDTIIDDLPSNTAIKRFQDGLEYIGGAQEIYDIITNHPTLTSKVPLKSLKDYNTAYINWARNDLKGPYPQYVSLLEKASLALDGIALTVDIGADFIHHYYRRLLSDAVALQRLEALQRLADGNYNIDQAMRDGFILAKAQVNALHNEYYSQSSGMGAALREAIWDNKIDLAGYAIKIGTTYKYHALGKALLPYYISWHIWKGIRGKQEVAQQATLAATMFMTMQGSPNSNIFRDVKNLIESPDNSFTYSNLITNVRLFDMYAYLAYYFYDKCIETFGEGLTSFYGRAREILTSDQGYPEFISDINDKREKNRNQSILSSYPYHLTKHRSLNVTATDKEYDWLLSKIYQGLPEIAQYQKKFRSKIGLFYGEPSGTAPLQIQVGDASVFQPGSVDLWQWDFGDGSQIVEGQFPDAHLYEKPGIYHITLRLAGSGQTDTSQPFTISVEATPVTANFSSSQTLGTAPFMVNFSMLSSGVPTGQIWMFGDGESSNESSPSHTYAVAGQYTVTLTVYGEDSEDTIVRQNFIQVLGPTGNIEVDIGMNVPFVLTGPATHFGNGPHAFFADLPAGAYTLTLMGVDPGIYLPQTMTLGTGSTITFTNPNFVDTDDDGMPDSWEIEHNLNKLVDDALDDADVDGFCNLREYLSGTDPRNENDRPSILADFEDDNDVDGKDLSYFIDEFGRTDCDTAPDPCEFDFDTDGDVDEIDLWLFIEDYGRSTN